MNRKKLIAAVVGTFAVAGVAFGAYWATSLRNFESTDDAYVNGNVVQVTSQVAGTVASIAANDTEFVRSGTPLVQLDTADAKVALDEAESQLAKTVRQVRNLYATSGQLAATARQFDAELARATDDLGRRERLAASGFISNEALAHERATLRAADAAASAAKQQLAAHQALVEHTTLESHPDVRNAAAKVREAYLAYARTTLQSPVSGYVAKRTVQVGQRIAPGAPLMAVIALDDIWVDANFKEAQLRHMRVGQPVTLSADLYGDKLEYHGKVMGFGAGTGGAFALLPAQNASGNWIKIVQRVPVRIALEGSEVASHPLQVGLSMQVKVDTHDQGGERLPRVAQSRGTNEANPLAAVESLADERVKSIILVNDGRAARAPVAALAHPAAIAAASAAPSATRVAIR
jgi:membrane fusion protein (multidrug efflux system)